MMNAPVPRRMTVAEYFDWALAQPNGRYELVDGKVIAMSPERIRHNRTKLAAVIALRNAIAQAGLPCEAFTDGMTVVIDEYTAREPDASVQCGKSPDEDTLILERPLIVVEVVSRSSERDDTGAKLVEYFSVATIRHYLIVNPEKRVLVHHARLVDDQITTRILSGGELDLSPPGLVVSVDELLGPVRA